MNKDALRFFGFEIICLFFVLLLGVGGAIYAYYHQDVVIQKCIQQVGDSKYCYDKFIK